MNSFTGQISLDMSIYIIRLSDKKVARYNLDGTSFPCTNNVLGLNPDDVIRIIKDTHERWFRKSVNLSD